MSNRVQIRADYSGKDIKRELLTNTFQLLFTHAEKGIITTKKEPQQKTRTHVQTKHTHTP